ncbi:Gp37-like protein [Rhodococcus pyridinivorans]|uniref:Gp37-like protein n=1 Tax=Rhodococcus pyridinivorans TaxID=103816 RepID=UPI003AAEA448
MPATPNYLVYDAANRLVEPITGHESATIKWSWTDAHTGSIVIPGQPSDALLTTVLDADIRPVLFKADTAATRPFTGRIHNAEYLDEGEGPSLELTIVGDRIWFDAMLAVAFPAGSPAEQAGHESDTRTGPLETVVKGYIADAADRLSVPMVVVPAPDPDPSPTVTLSARMITLSELIGDALAAHGYGIDVRMWRTGDPLPAAMTFEPEPGTLIVDVITPVDNRNLLWQQEQLATWSLSSTARTAHRAYVGGPGSGTDRTFSEWVDADAAAAQGRFALPELYVDNNSEATDAATAARAALAGKAGGKTVRFTVVDENPWRFGLDWELGHFAYARIAGGLFRAQITEVELDEQPGKPITYTPQCGPAAPGRPEEVIEAVARLTAQLRTQQARR